MSAQLQNQGATALPAESTSLLDAIVSQSRVARNATEHDRTKDLIGELVREVMDGTVVVVAQNALDEERPFEFADPDAAERGFKVTLAPRSFNTFVLD